MAATAPPVKGPALKTEVLEPEADLAEGQLLGLKPRFVSQIVYDYAPQIWCKNF